MRATAVAHANIALIKYWGKRDVELNLPAVGSISVTLDALKTTTTVRFDEGLAADTLLLNGEDVPADTARISEFLDIVGRAVGKRVYADVTTENNFPTGAGLASSASGFAALTAAVNAALDLGLTTTEQSALARRGSASAARSIFGGFVEMYRGVEPGGGDCFASPLATTSHWPLSVLVAITSRQRKSIGSTEGMNLSAATSPYYSAWVRSNADDLELARRAVINRDFESLAEISEFSCLKMHGLMMSTNPGLVFWNATTVALIHRVRELRKKGSPAFFTIDAGPQVKVLCLPEAAEALREELAAVGGVEDVVSSGLGPAACVLEEPS